MKDFYISLPILFLLAVLLLVSAFFSASETALIALGKIRLRQLVNRGVKNAKLVHRLVTNLDRLIATILVSNNFVNIAISTIGAALAIYLFGPRRGVVIATIAITICILIFCEITPKIFAAQRPEKVSLAIARPMQVIIRLLDPLVKIFTGISKFIIKAFGGEITKRSPLITEGEIRLMIEVGKEEGVLGDEERKMLQRIFEFGDTKVEEVMVPKEEIVSLDINANPQHLIDLVVKEGHSRIPVYRDNIDNVAGIIYARDLLQASRDKEPVIIEDMVHSPYFVSRTKRVNELLRDFRQKRIHMAIVVDRDNRTSGLVTLEDLIEEIVGEIEDEIT